MRTIFPRVVPRYNLSKLVMNSQMLIPVPLFAEDWQISIKTLDAGQSLVEDLVQTAEATFAQL